MQQCKEMPKHHLSKEEKKLIYRKVTQKRVGALPLCCAMQERTEKWTKQTFMMTFILFISFHLFSVKIQAKK